jgi:hypothetical protein
MDGRTVRDLLRAATTATLATLDAATGHPYASLVAVATLPDARPVLLLSRLARHTRNLDANPRASLLVDQRCAGLGDSPLAAERAALIGTVCESSEPTCRRRYLARYPSAEAYAGFADFGFRVLDIAEAHVIAGFGRIGVVAGDQLALSAQAADELARQEADILARVNAGLVAAGGGCEACALDLEGVDIRHGAGLRRIVLPEPAIAPEKLVETILSAIGGRP